MSRYLFPKVEDLVLVLEVFCLILFGRNSWSVIAEWIGLNDSERNVNEFSYLSLHLSRRLADKETNLYGEEAFDCCCLADRFSLLVRECDHPCLAFSGNPAMNPVLSLTLTASLYFCAVWFCMKSY